MTWLSERGIATVVDREVGELLAFSPGDKTKVVDRAELCRRCPLIVVLGGDGTLISASRHPADPSPIVVGVNLGQLGFLTEITTDELWLTLEQVLAQSAPSIRRFLLSIVVMRGDKQIGSYFALNDAVVTKEAIARIFGVDLLVNEEAASTIRGDGVIISTPSGSTAYSLAAGGSIVHPQVDALLVTPICPHSLTSRPLVLPGSSRISLRINAGSIQRRAGANALRETNGVYLTIDGQEGLELLHGDLVTVTTSSKSVIFVRSPSRSYFQVLGTKLHWGGSTLHGTSPNSS
jgi:NAD+ kinase